jgi:hypothetical protein
LAQTQISKVELRQLRRGRIFWLFGERGKVVYSNECRARVRLPQTKQIKGKTIKGFHEIDLAPSTPVIVEVKATNRMDFGDL